MSLKIFLIILIQLSFYHSSSGQKNGKFIYQEEFNNNNFGWVEEFTDAHVTEIKDGFLHINSFDTSKYQSSNGPQNLSFLWGLPTNYEILSNFQITNNKMPTTMGIILYSSTLNYRFAVSDSSFCQISEYDYNDESTTVWVEKKLTSNIIATLKPVTLQILISGRTAAFYVNDELIGETNLKAKSWNDLRLFTTTGSSIRIDYLRIK